MGLKLALKAYGVLNKFVAFLKSLREFGSAVKKETTPESTPIRKYTNPQRFRSKVEKDEYERRTKDSL